VSILSAVHDWFTPYQAGKDFYKETASAYPPQNSVEFTTADDAQKALALVRQAIAEESPLKAEITQLRFLLNSAPMMDAPTERERILASRSPFAYVHPKTFASMLQKARISGPARSFNIFPGSPTKWVLTSCMPEGRVIYSPLAIPGLEKILGK
jgi:hypothetical protein